MIHFKPWGRVIAAAGLALTAATSVAFAQSCGTYEIEFSGVVEGQAEPSDLETPCRNVRFEMDSNMATNESGPWSLNLPGTAEWKGKPVAVSVNLTIPPDAGPGEYEIGRPSSDSPASAYLWMALFDREMDSVLPPDLLSNTGTLTLERRDATAITGEAELTLVTLDNPDPTVSLTASFEEIPYIRGAEVELLETTGAVTLLDASMPDDPLINFLTPAKAVETDEGLTVSLGQFGPSLKLVFPPDYSGEFTAGPEAPVSISFANGPVSGSGTLKRDDDWLSGKLTARLGSHAQIDGAGSLTLRFSDLPIQEAGE
jgi:hypothetical protein